MNEIEVLVNQYITWYKDEIKIKKLQDSSVIMTPFLDQNNDYISIYVELEGDEIILSDDGYYLNNLEMYGVNITKNRKEIIDNICSQFDAFIEDSEITIKCHKREYPAAMHRMIQVILSIDDLYNISQGRIKSLFFDDVKAYFDSKEIYYTENVQFSGKTKYTHKFDFLFQRNKDNPERICKLLNNATKTNMATLIFSWLDTKETRGDMSKLFVLINDENKIDKGVVNGFSEYEITPYKWSEIENHISSFR